MTKHLFTVILLIVSFSISAYAQKTPREPRHPRPHAQPEAPVDLLEKDDGYGAKLNIGICFAPSFSWMYPGTAGYERNGTTLHFHTGVNLNINLTERKNFYFTTGILYERLGGKLTYVDNVEIPGLIITPGTTTNRTYTAQYMTIPVGVTLKTNPIHNFSFGGNIGLYNSFLIGATNRDGYFFMSGQTGQEPELWERQKSKYDECSLLKEAIYGGIGVEYSLTRSTRASVYLNYAHTLTNFFKGRGQAVNSMTGEPLKAKMGCVEIVLGFNFF
ncbi:MAG: outer membrane beta-barrel protein [Bacteroidales bacterium]|nr:outer membrane beta-barrel protein [Bacteroidales bacterium]